MLAQLLAPPAAVITACVAIAGTARDASSGRLVVGRLSNLALQLLQLGLLAVCLFVLLELGSDEGVVVWRRVR